MLRMILNKSYILSLMLVVVGMAMPMISGKIYADTADKRLRDPTMPLLYQTKKKETISLNLQAIFERESGREAVINGKQVKVGDAIGGAKITVISRDKVFYMMDGKSKSLVLRASIF